MLLEELPLTFPSEHVQLIPLEFYGKKRPLLKKIELKLLRNSAAFYALLSESLYADRLFGNILTNFKRLPEAFYANAMQDQFKDVPAIICGAGPSLAKSAAALKTVENRALIFAGGSAGAALGHLGIMPHFLMALDPNREEYERFKPITSFEIPFLYANRLYPSVFTVCNGPFGYMRTQTGGMVEEWIEKKLQIQEQAIGPDLGREAFSVTTLAIAFAFALGCNPIIFAGVDLAYTGMKRYAAGVLKEDQVAKQNLLANVKASDRLLIKKDCFGKPLHTLVKWVMESDSIAAFAKSHPERLFLNATQGGLGFKGIADLSLEEAAAMHCRKEIDLRGKIHACLNEVPGFAYQKPIVEEVCKELEESLQRSLMICERYLKELEKLEQKGRNVETGQMALLKMDLEQECAFECLIESFEGAVRRLFPLYAPDSLSDQKQWLKQETMLWTEVHRLIHNSLK